MPKLREYSAKAIRVSALWVAKRRDIMRIDKLWILICRGQDPYMLDDMYPKANGVAPLKIREKVRKFICNAEGSEDIYNDWMEEGLDNKNIQRRAMKLVIKLLEEHERQ